jgi:hypothetical protein
MKHRVLFLSLACAAALAACQTTSTVPSLVANAARSDRAGTTQAWGYVYSDPEGKPLANLPVELAAWLPIHGRLQPSHQVARTNAAGRFAFTAPNGKYLLTIGNDEAYTPPPGYQTPDPLTSVGDDPGLPNMHWLATVHDTIVLSGGSQEVKASVLPKQIVGQKVNGLYIFARVPAIENTRKYRVAELSDFEAECLVAEQLRRQHLRRPPLVPDEWLLENTRAMHKAQVDLNLVWDGFDWAAIGAPAKTPQSSSSGGTTCASIVEGQTIKSQEQKAGTLWFAAAGGFGRANAPKGERDLFEVEEWFLDPRLTPQIWPSPVTGLSQGG